MMDWIQLAVAELLPGFVVSPPHSGSGKNLPLGLIGGTIFALLVWALTRKSTLKEKEERKTGWRVGHAGRDAMFYEEYRNGLWKRIPVDGEMLGGTPHHVIYFKSLELPDWAEERREEIIERIKSAFPAPDYQHDGA